MQELEKILEEIEQRKARAEKLIVKPPHDKLDQVANDTAEAFIEAYKECQDIIRKHMNDGWIPCIERMPTKRECENNYFWIMLKYNASPVIAKCAWIESEDKNGNDDSFPEFFIDQYPQMYTPSKNIIMAWKISDVPEPYRPERSES